jgi:hypothetical protein
VAATANPEHGDQPRAVAAVAEESLAVAAEVDRATREGATRQVGLDEQCGSIEDTYFTRNARSRLRAPFARLRRPNARLGARRFGDWTGHGGGARMSSLIYRWSRSEVSIANQVSERSTI